MICYPQITRKVEILYIMCKTAINMEQRTVTIKKFSRIENPDIHYRRMTYHER